MMRAECTVAFLAVVEVDAFILENLEAKRNSKIRLKSIWGLTSHQETALDLFLCIPMNINRYTFVLKIKAYFVCRV